MNIISQLQTVDPRQLRLIGYGTATLIVVAIVMYLILPQWRIYQATSQSLNIMRTNIAAGAGLDAQLEALRFDVNELERTLNGDASNLPAKQMEAFVIGRLQTISWRNRLKLVSVQPSEGQPIDQFRELVFDVELSGNYFAMFDWLADISEELGFIVVKRFDIETKSRNRIEDAADLSVKLTMAAYRSQGK